MMFFKCNQVFTLVFLLLLYFNNIVYTHVDDIKNTSQKKITYDKYNKNKENMNNEKNDNKDNIYNDNINNDNINNEDEYKFLSMKHYKDSLSNKLNNENDHMNYLIRKRKDNTQGSQHFNENIENNENVENNENIENNENNENIENIENNENNENNENIENNENNENNENSSIMNSESYNNIINSNEHNEEQIKKKEEDLIEAFFPFILKKLDNESLSLDNKYDDYYNLPNDHNDTHKENSSDHNLLGYKLGNNLKSYLIEENDVSQKKTDDINESASSDSENIQEILSTDSNTSHLKERKNQKAPSGEHKPEVKNALSNSQVASPKGEDEKKSQPQHPLVNSGDQLQHPKEIDENAEKIRRTLLKEIRDIKNTTAIIDETVYKFEQLIMKGRYYATAVKNFVIFKVNYICEYSKCGPNSRCYIVEKDKEQCRCRPNYIVDMSVNYFKCIPMKDMNCSKNNGGCDVNAECTIVEGAVKCQCSHLYFGDGVFCVKNSQTKQTLYILFIVILLVFQNFFI
ncbi:merozoite surface protein 10 [Plasmodium falciparum IGH-CR14]|uniref:Merozoite surface protein 10 n=1 Tax=Plasmodium falciparum IGH-CR14 TaxID=580059 RepID=A0A0L1I954_PLAFA|nr:merozoite surface protein 10 [Plasmodium falciparum IGH-CR14]